MRDRQQKWTRIALWLVISTMIYNMIEAGIAIWSGIDTKSIALVGFGLDSIIEFAAACVLLWRLAVEARGAEHDEVERVEQKVHRFVGITFMALAIYVLCQSIWIIWRRETPEESIIGIILAIFSLIIMPLVSLGKIRAANMIGSPALKAEAKETLACSFLSFTLLLGLVANAVAGWWWADPTAAMLMVPWLIKEGIEGIRGEGCEDDDEEASCNCKP